MTTSARIASRAGGAGAMGASEPLQRVYVWDLVVRTTHWLIALSIFVLAFTGIYIGRPFLIVDPHGGRFVMGTVKAIHSWTAIVFSLAVLARIAWMFLGRGWARWTQLFPTTKDRWRGSWETFKFYTFVRRDEPGFTGHNPLAGLAYIAVFGLYLVEIATGLGMYSLSASAGSWTRAFTFLVPLLGGTQTIRWLHHVAMWLLLGFFVHHVASALLMARAERNGTMDSIFSGYKFVPRREDLSKERAGR